MTNRLWPADAVGGSPAYSGRALRQTQAPFVAGATAARPLGARSGVRPGTSTGTVNATPTTWFCNSHAGVLDVQTAAEAGPYTYAIDSTVSGALVASNASNPRTDIVYAQVTDAAEDGAAPGQAPVVTIGYLAGTASATAPAPAAPARSMVLARINVPKTGGGNPTVSWVAPTAVAAGAPFLALTKDTLDAIPGFAGARAVVYADATAALNGDYAWTSGAWRRTVQHIPFSANSDASGFIDVPHNLGVVPDSVQVQLDAADTDTRTLIQDATVWVKSATLVRLRIIRRDTNTYFTGNPFRGSVVVARNA